MAGILGGVLGASVTWTPSGGSAAVIAGIFREEPTQVPTEDGGMVLVTQPTLSVQRPAAESIARNDTVAPGNGKTYRIAAPHPSGSPAADAFIIFTLELSE